ncbi:dUTPase, putative [Talaromyces stipitatus ATCC 10500]|uniref:dUTPase, putative n=1 Tax=Talaromyces stipitatus (strain ATCC 10500 / CBS 375.48 / QM 6759 / NRRL 1006) TaxID=441959 RepID=B8MSL2_TALSN|nr:dUTPase, putative [Talaromyces stipitatus ATCC 10500]EED12341.1 dUTPase, putative [Talaromyces stipitatus ATCC 10500]
MALSSVLGLAEYVPTGELRARSWCLETHLHSNTSAYTESTNNMILTGRRILTQNFVRSLLQPTHQQQPCGIDLTLRQISKWTSAATIDFSNTQRQAAKTSLLEFTTTAFSQEEGIKLEPGAYLVDFNESVRIPLNCMASVFPRSSLWRNGVGIVAGVVDAGYEGAMGAMMDVRNPEGVVLHKNAKVAQIVFCEMTESVKEGYKGVYQFAGESVGRDGTAT